MTNKERKRIFRAWIKALRSGKYKQGRERLRNDDGFCCLGVLADIEIEGDWVLSGDGYALVAEGLVYDTEPPDDFAQDLRIYAHINDFEAMNDGGIFCRRRARSFSEIADYIESVVMPEALGDAE